jgi:protein involved in polysaccharide export with SLBB domain
LARSACLGLKQWDSSLRWLVALVALSGCHSVVSRPSPRMTGPQTPPPAGEAVPTEKDKSSLPPYTIEPPDILYIEALRVIPKPPYHLQAGDELSIVIEPDDPSIRSGRGFFIDPGGRIDLGPRVAKAQVGGLTVDEATEVVVNILKEELREPEVSLTVMQTTGMQPITGEHLVSPDGTVNLGTYGLVYVAGMTVDEAKSAIEAHLADYLDHPQISASVFAYNSKVYYVVTQGGPQGDQVARLPITGNETVLDAIANIQGLSRLSSKNIWIARPAPGGMSCDLILPVNWGEITAGAATATNYQVLPGDRIFIAENKLVAIDGVLQQMIAPFERIFGVTLLGTQTVQTINRFPLGISGLGSGF